MFQLGSAPGKGFWARHRWKMLLSLGVAGAGYVAYRFYDAHQKQLVRVEQHRGGARRRRDHQESVSTQTQTTTRFVFLVYVLVGDAGYPVMCCL